MIFNSVTYLLFLVLVVCLYWVLPRRARLWMILLSSLTFYGFWRPEFLVVILASAITDYFIAFRIGQTDSILKKKLLLAVSLTVNLGLLFYFKYLFFMVDNAVIVLRFLGYEIEVPEMSIILPLGISFYTFQTISYTVDVYRGFIKPERDFVLYACFVSFFPQLVAGPILRAGEVLFQLDKRPDFHIENISSGLRRISYGLFLKVVLADNIAPLVDAGFNLSIENISAIDVWNLAFLFGFQIYFDFSAYSHIAIGSARLMGINFPENFNFPYMSVSPKDFWRRWHISLSSWIRDYLYLPLLGAKARDRSVDGLSVATEETRKSLRHPVFALFATWAIMGLWHGANWTFVMWGLYHASVIVVYRLVNQHFSETPVWLKKWGGWIVTAPVMMLSWIPFRAQSVADALAMCEKVFIPREYLYLGMRENTYLVTTLLILSVIISYFFHRQSNFLSGSFIVVKLAGEFVFAATIICLVFVFLRPISQFIYFQF